MECNITDEPLLICRICMTDSSAVPLLNSLESSFLDLTGIHTHQEALKDDLPLALCAECHRGFSQCLKFVEKAQRSNAALCELKQDGKLTRDNIKEKAAATTNNVDIEFCEIGLGGTTYHDVHIKLEKCEEVDVNKFVKVELQEGFKEVRKKEPIPDLEITFNSELSNSDRESNQHNDSHTSSDDEQPACTEKPTTKAKKKTLKTIAKKKRTKKNHSSEDPTSTAFDLFSFLLKHFTFSMLKNEEQRIEFEKRKLDEAYTGRKYQCDLCYRGFKFKETYDRHVEQKHAQHPSRPHKCEICSTYFTTRKYLREHLLLHSELFKCKLCDYVTEKRNAAKLHISWHEGKVYKCKHCPQTFKRQTTLFNHNRTSHAVECVCADCGFSFASQRGLRSHRKLRHAESDLSKISDNGPQCEECNIKFVTDKALDTHRKVSPKHNTSGNRLRNDANALRLKELAEVGSDSKTHVLDPNNSLRRRGKLRDQNVQCEKCGIALPSFFAYRKHFSTTHPGEIRTLYPATSGRELCNHCGKVFVSKAYLREHMNVHTKSTIISCTDCDKTFYSRVTYTVHRQTHAGVKYPCDVCGKTFTKCSNRDRHVDYVHSDVKNIKCSFCEKYFKSVKEQKGHIDHVHYKKPWPKRSRKRETRRIRSERD